MSHASGAVLFKDGDIKFYEYNGTSDVVISLLHNTMDGVRDSWRSYESVRCTCGGEEDVEIYSSYGYGFCFNGKACRKCSSVRALCGVDEYPEETWKGTKNNNSPKWLKDYWKLKRRIDEDNM